MDARLPAVGSTAQKLSFFDSSRSFATCRVIFQPPAMFPTRVICSWVLSRFGLLMHVM
jgi:hypothetical protein